MAVVLKRLVELTARILCCDRARLVDCEQKYPRGNAEASPVWKPDRLFHARAGLPGRNFRRRVLILTSDVFLFSRSRETTMKANSRTFPTILLFGIFATSAAARELGRAHFQTSARRRHSRSSTAASRWFTRSFIQTALLHSLRSRRPISSAQLPTGYCDTVLADARR